MTIVYTNQPNWFGNSAEPLKNGYIYVGEPGTNPKTTPTDRKTVTFTDSGGNSFTATQPLRTNEQGQIQYNGKAVTAEVTGDYSLIIEDSKQVQIENGYIANVSDASSGGDSSLTDYREYQLTLADVKKLDKTPGQTVSSIGKSSTTDNEGADWLVVTNTGGTADDVDLIDFDNGTQGVRIKNFLEQAVTTQDKQDVRDNINAQEQPESVTDYVATVDYYITENGQSATSFDIASNIGASYESIGPSGSGATNIWTEMDGLPLDAKYIRLLCSMSWTSNANTLGRQQCNFRSTGGSAGTSQAINEFGVSAGTASRANYGTTLDVPLDSANTFQVNYNPNLSGGAADNVFIRIVGFGT